MSVSGLFLVVGPSGAGKTSLVQAMLTMLPHVRKGVTTTTRAPRPGEVNGIDYNFVSPVEFAQLSRDGAFLETDLAFGQFYGVPRSLLDPPGDLVLIVTVSGMLALKRWFPQAKTILVLPESTEQAVARIRTRSAPDEAERVRDLRAATVADASAGFDVVIRNSEFSLALTQLASVFTSRPVA